MDIPKYTRFELAKMIKEKRIREGLSMIDVASKYNMTRQKLLRIEKATCLYTVRIYEFACEFLEMTQEEILAKEPDNTPSLDGVDEEIKRAVLLACEMFDEMIMQEKIATN